MSGLGLWDMVPTVEGCGTTDVLRSSLLHINRSKPTYLLIMLTAAGHQTDSLGCRKVPLFTGRDADGVARTLVHSLQLGASSAMHGW